MDDENIEQLGNILNDTLNNINEQLIIFFKHYKKKYKKIERINTIICTNKLFRYRKRLILLSDIIKNSENHQKYELNENKKKNEMY